MVFTATDDQTESDQTSLIKGKQRKNVTSSRKNKTVFSSSPAKFKESPSKSCPKVVNKADPKTSMGNTSVQCTSNAVQHDKVVHEVSLPSDPNSNVDKCNNHGDDSMLQSTMLQDYESLCCENNGDNADNQITKLKNLLLLQVSLISRQQDLLRLRDHEIMQLKASNSNYKCQLNRVRRRMSKRRSDGQEESPKSTKRKSSESISENLSSVSNDVSVVDNQTQTIPLPQSSKSPDGGMPQSKRRRLNYSEESKSASDVNDSSYDPENGKLADIPGPSNLLMSPVDKRERIAVPVSFIERKQDELMQAMMLSPPEKAVKTFCEITNSSPRLDEFPFKICDRCPHCVAIGEEMTRLFKMAENSKPFGSPRSSETKNEEKEFFEIAGITSSSSGMEYYLDTNESKEIPIMRTSVSFHRAPPSFDQNHWWWDLKCGNIKSDKSLKIPTWKVQEVPPLSVKEEITSEATDDQTYTKRHTKLELDEKRRKKWDIQRIREFRYNERLRQKLLKQGAMYEPPSVESLSGNLHDAECVEVDESLPINVFGYPVPHMYLEEFDLSRLKETLKSSNPSSNKRRSKKV